MSRLLTRRRSRQLVASLAALILLAACHPGECYTIVNTSDEVRVLMSRGIEFERLTPGGEVGVFMPNERDYVVIHRWSVLDESGALIAEVTVTWDDLVERDFRVEIP